ncbi:hypothetical protein A2U01_0043761, partial [Trifolium medium]|nr:hypothetical protein [Trifolium medium]
GLVFDLVGWDLAALGCVVSWWFLCSPTFIRCGIWRGVGFLGSVWCSLQLLVVVGFWCWSHCFGGFNSVLVLFAMGVPAVFCCSGCGWV